MEIKKICEDYFDAYKILFSKNRTEGERVLAGFEVASYFTIIIPLMFGIILGIDRLAGRVSKNLPQTITKSCHFPTTTNKIMGVAGTAIINPTRRFSFESLDDVDQSISTETIELSPDDFIKMLNANTPFSKRKKILIDGSLDLSFRKKLTALPNRLKVTGDLNLMGCKNLTALPNDLHVGGGIDLSFCAKLTALPNDFEVRGDLLLISCKNLSALPNDLKVGGSLYLLECKNLTSLPFRLKVGADLSLLKCMKLTSLPNNLEVGGNLNLLKCHNLTSFPNGLRVGGGLSLWDCINLTTLPNDLEVGGNLNLRGCKNLIALPAWIAGLGGKSDGSVRTIDISGTGLSEDVIARLQNTPYDGIQFHFSKRIK